MPSLSQSSLETASRRSMGLRAMLTTFTAAALMATAIVGAMSLWGARQAGDAAAQTFVAKDVTADILPPPLYLIEMRLVLSQGVEGTLALDAVKAEVTRLESEYTARVKFWKDNPPYGLAGKLLGRQHDAGMAFIAAAGKLVDALGEKAEASALQAALGAAHVAYLAHRAGVDATVDVVDDAPVEVVSVPAEPLLAGNVAPVGITRVSPGWMMLFSFSEFARSSADNLIW